MSLGGPVSELEMTGRSWLKVGKRVLRILMNPQCN